MPIYEYECTQCGHRFDRRQRFDDEPVALCPECQSKARRVMHSVAVIYKGSGFYTTDYPRSGDHSRPKEPQESAKKEPAETAAKPPSPKE